MEIEERGLLTGVEELAGNGHITRKEQYRIPLFRVETSK